MPTFSSRLNERPDFHYEEAAYESGCRFVAGVDEVGRGPLAGPVVAAAVMFITDKPPDGINDSKKLTEARRNVLFEQICDSAVIAVTSLSASQIDAVNIRSATLCAMTHAIEALAVKPDLVLIDGRDVPPDLSIPAKAIIGGDTKSLSIAAASIVAKVTRDRLMAKADRTYPAYFFKNNKGYGTKSHRAAINKYGACPLHRKSFNPVKSLLNTPS